jgi:hypothetical protein
MYYSGCRLNVAVFWSQVEEQLLSGTLPSETYSTFWHHFYSMFETKILIPHYYFLKETYAFTTVNIFKSGEMNIAFIPK